MSGPSRSRGWAHQKAAAQYKAQCRRLDAHCWLCSQPIDYDADRDDPNSFQQDHVVAVTKAPHLAQDPANWRPSHRSCNGSKNAGPPKPMLGTTTRAW